MCLIGNGPGSYIMLLLLTLYRSYNDMVDLGTCVLLMDIQDLRRAYHIIEKCGQPMTDYRCVSFDDADENFHSRTFLRNEHLEMK